METKKKTVGKKATEKNQTKRARHPERQRK